MHLASLFSFSRRAIVASAAALIVLSFAYVAIADIVSGIATSNVSSNVTITRLTLDRPTVSAGDFMLASVAINGGNAVNVAAPSGWTQISRTDNDVNVSLISYWKIAGASEPSTYTWTIDQQTRAVGGIVPYTGVDTANPIDAVAGNIGLSTAANTASVTTNAANEAVVALFATDVTKPFTVPAGMAQKFTLSNGSLGPTELVADELQTAAGSTGIKTSSISGNKARSWSSQLIALRRPSAPITFDNSISAYQNGSAPISAPFTVGVGNNRMLVVGIIANPPAEPADVVTGVTYGGAPATLLAKAFYTSTQGPEEVYLFALPAPTSGSNNLVTTLASDASVQVYAVSYSNVDQSIPTNVVPTTGTGTTLTLPITVINQGAWVAGIMGNNSACMSFDSVGTVRQQFNCALIQFDALGTPGTPQTFIGNLNPAAVAPAWGGVVAELKAAQ